MRRYARCTGLIMLMLLMGAGQESKNPCVAITGKMVEVGTPIQVTTETDVVEFQWLQNGRYLVYLREAQPYSEAIHLLPSEPKPIHKEHPNALYLFNTKTRRIILLHQNNIAFWTVVVNGRAVLYAMREETPQPKEPDASFADLRTYTLYLRFVEQAQPKAIAQVKGLTPIYAFSPSRRYLLTTPMPTQLIDLQAGRVVRVFEPGFLVGFWASDTELYLCRATRDPDHREYARYNLLTDQLEPTSREVYNQVSRRILEVDDPTRPPTTRNLTLQREGISREANRLDLCSRNAHTERFACATVAYDSDWQHYSIAPDESGIAYRSWRGQLFYIPLAKRDPRTLLEQLACGQKPTKEAIREHYRSNGKQIALAAYMYCQDYDELLPPNNNITELLMPYLKDRDVFLDAFTGQPIFTYLLDGQSLASIEYLAETRLGILDWGDPDWIVVLYADAHVRLERRK